MEHPGKLGKCRSCDTPVRWVETTKGNWMPLDRDPDPDGNIVFDARGRAQVLARGQVPSGLDSYVWMSHFATCPGHARGKDAQRRALQRTRARVHQQLALEPEADPEDVEAVQRVLPFAVQHYFRGTTRGPSD